MSEDWKPYWFCTVHRRIATHTNAAGDYRCDPKLGGIMIPCQVIYTYLKDDEMKAADGNEPTLTQSMTELLSLLKERLRCIEDLLESHGGCLISLQNEVNELAVRLAAVEPKPTINERDL